MTLPPVSPNAVDGHAGRPITDGAASVITRIEELSYELKVRQVMTRELKTARPDMPMRALLDLFHAARISGAPVVAGDGCLLGIVSIEDLVRYLNNTNLGETVAAYMTASVYTARAEDPVVEALELFARYKVGRLPVVDDDGRLVGILTKGDVTRGVLRSLQTDYRAEEVRRYRASHLFEDIDSDRTSLIMRYNVAAGDFAQGGQASSHIKRALLRLGADAQLARRCGIAIYEAEMNLIIHTRTGGVMRIEIEPHRITMKVTDDGPGIPDVQLAMQAGYSTASDEIRALGFGAGMGLKNMQRCVDELTLESRPGGPTKLEMRINLQPEENLGTTYRLLGGETP
jgi:CBS domain-containing protein/anti-sigma regulatory factor (Ser/Thr protein kinase)